MEVVITMKHNPQFTTNTAINVTAECSTQRHTSPLVSCSMRYSWSVCNILAAPTAAAHKKAGLSEFECSFGKLTNLSFEEYNLNFTAVSAIFVAVEWVNHRQTSQLVSSQSWCSWSVCRYFSCINCCSPQTGWLACI